MTTLTTAQLLGIARSPVAPTGFVAVPADKLVLPDSAVQTRIDYKGFYNPQTNELIITGTPKPFLVLNLSTSTQKDIGIFDTGARVQSGPNAGAFIAKPLAAEQTEDLVTQLTAPRTGEYPNAKVTFAGEGTVGTALAIASYGLRTDASSQVSVGATVTLNAWTGPWTQDGKVDTGVLDIRTPSPANADIGLLNHWKSGGVVAQTDTGNAQAAAFAGDVGTQLVIDGVAAGLSAAGKLFGEGIGWVTEKLLGKGADAVKETAADTVAAYAASAVDSPARINNALGWRADLTPEQTIQVQAGNLSQGQWNVMAGLSPSGYAVGSTTYASPGNITTVGAGSTAEQRQSVTQVSTYKDEATGAIMEVRLSGQLVNGQFQASSTPAFAAGMDVAGRAVFTGETARNIAVSQILPSATVLQGLGGNDGVPTDSAALPPVVVAGNASQYNTVIVQTHGNSTASFEFVNDDKSRAWVLQNATTGGRTVVQMEASDVPGAPRTTVYDINKDGVKSDERYFSTAGNPVSSTGAPVSGDASAAANPNQNSVTPSTQTTQGTTFTIIGIGQGGQDTGGAQTQGGANTDANTVTPSTTTNQTTPGTTFNIKPGAISDQISQIREALGLTEAAPRLPAIAVIADSGTGIQTDDGVIAGYGNGTGGDTSNQPTTPITPAQPATNTLAPDSTNNYTNYLATTGAALSPAQQDALASQLQSLNLGGTDALSFITLPGGSTVIANVDGDIVGEISQLKGGFTRLVSNRINEDGGIEPFTSYVNPKGQEASQADYQQALDTAQFAEAGTALGLMNSIIALDRWEQMNDLQRVAAVASIYNTVDKIAGNALPGDFGGAVAVLGFLTALDRGDVGGIAVSGIAVVDFFAEGIASEMIGSALGMQAANVIPGLNMVIAIASGDPVQMLAAAAAFIPVYGPIISIGITILGALFGGGEPPRPAIPDTPMSEGEAHAQWDAAGNTTVVTDQDSYGGGATAVAWMNHLTGALQTRLQSYTDAEGNGYGLIANMLPSIGFQYDPDIDRGRNSAGSGGGMGGLFSGLVAYTEPAPAPIAYSAQLILRWVDEQGMPQHRNYDRDGNRSDGSTIAGDFMKHAQGAIAPNWQVQTVLAHYQQGQGIHLPTLKAGLPQALGDGLLQSLQAITVDLPTEGIHQHAQDVQAAELEYQNALAQQDKLVDIDGDGYLEQSQWLANNQAVLSIDANGNGQIDAGELLSLSGAGLNALNWLDTNHDQRIDARDPAFAALRLWIDINGDANSRGETQTLTQAGIVAIDFSSNPPQVIRADNSSATLTVQTLTGDILGVNYQSITGGVLQQDEQRNADGTLAGPIQTLHAINTRLFDGQAAHVSGGVAAPTIPGSASTVDAGDSRLSSTSARTIANQSLQINAMLGVGDARLTSGVAGRTSTAQAQQTTTTAQVRSNGIAFIPMGTTSAAQEQRNATEAMIRSADSGLFGTAGGVLPLAAVGIGAAALQWPSVSNAASGNNSGSGSDGVQTRNDSGGGGSDGDDSSVVVGSSSNLASSSALVFAESGSTPGSSQSTSNTSNTLASNQFDPSNQALAQQIRAQAAPESIAVQSVSNTDANSASFGRASFDTNRSDDNDNGDDDSNQATTFTTASGTVLAYPRAHGETANGVEDTQLRFAQKLLLANDSTDNVASNPNQPALRITAVFSPTHGNVSLQTGADGLAEVVFNPDSNYHGTASFSYTVTDQYGLSSVATTSLRIAAVNDAPVTQDETASGDEDTTLRFTAASLLANDSDVETGKDSKTDLEAVFTLSNMPPSQWIRAQAAIKTIVMPNNKNHSRPHSATQNNSKIDFLSDLHLSKMPKAQWIRAQAAPKNIVNTLTCHRFNGRARSAHIRPKTCKQLNNRELMHKNTASIAFTPVRYDRGLQVTAAAWMA